MKMYKKSDGFILLEAMFSIVFLVILISLINCSIHSLGTQNHKIKLKKEAIEIAVNTIETESFDTQEYDELEVKSILKELNDKLLKIEVIVIEKDSGDIYAKLFAVKEK